MRQPPLSPEALLVFRTADPACPPVEIAAHAAAVREWDRVLAMVEREGMASVLWRELRRADAVVPEEVAGHLRTRALQRDLGMQRMAQRLQRTVQECAARGVPVLLLKGAAYAARHDGTLRSRPMNDVDVLVHRGDTARARDAVIASGWPETTDPGLLELLHDAHHLPHFVDPQDPKSRLELHVALMPSDQPFGFAEATLWRDAERAEAPFEGALVPSGVHLLLHACMHFAWQHSMAFGAWKTFRVVAATVARPGFDWDAFVQAAREAHALSCCYWTLRLASRLAGIAVPAAVLTALAPPNPRVVLDGLERHFETSIAVGEGPRSPSVKLTRWLWIVALRPKWSGHTSPGRFDPENKWAVTYGVASTESRAARYGRHLRNLGAWAEFMKKTFLS